MEVEKASAKLEKERHGVFEVVTEDYGEPLELRNFPPLAYVFLHVRPATKIDHDAGEEWECELSMGSSDGFSGTLSVFRVSSAPPDMEQLKAFKPSSVS